jgi:hypothetical protein
VIIQNGSVETGIFGMGPHAQGASMAALSPHRPKYLLCQIEWTLLAKAGHNGIAPTARSTKSSCDVGYDEDKNIISHA